MDQLGSRPQPSYCCRLHPIRVDVLIKPLSGTRVRPRPMCSATFPILDAHELLLCIENDAARAWATDKTGELCPSVSHGSCSAIRAKEPSSWSTCKRHAIILSLCGGELETAHCCLCLLTRAFEPRSSRLYDVGRLSVLGGIDADAIVKSSTNLQNSLSLNSRMLAYAATMRSARTLAWRSP
jgi:hypothetical protein